MLLPAPFRWGREGATLTIPVHEAAKPRNIQVTSSDQKQAVTA